VAKKIRIVLTLQLPAGKATPAPPVGTALGPHGINIVEFTKSYNEKTADKAGQVIPAQITIFEDRSFSFILKTPPAADLLRKAAGIDKGAGATKKEAVADAAALTAFLLPMMRKAGHDAARSGGLIAAASVVGPVIPPSIAFVIFGVAANVSISRLFLAGIFPGILIGAALWLTWWWLGRRELITPPPRKTLAEVLKAARQSAWALMLPLIILVGLRFGVFTPTEAAVVAAVYALFVAMVIYRELPFGRLYGVFVSAAKLSAVIMFLVAAAMVSAWLITIAQIPAQLVALLQPFLDNKTLLMLAIMVLVLAVGTAMDMTPTILILTPVLMPVIKAAGIDPVYFGVLFIINNSIGLITPPVGTVLNTVAGVGRMKLDDIMRGSAPFLLAEVAVLLLMVLFPPLVTVPARWLYG